MYSFRSQHPQPQSTAVDKPPHKDTEITIKMDGHDMVVDQKGGMDMTLGLGAVLALFHVFIIAYPSQLKKTFAFIDTFILY